MSCSIKISKKCRFSLLVTDFIEKRYENLERRIVVSFQRRNFLGRWVNGRENLTERASYEWFKKTRQIVLQYFDSEAYGALNNCVCRCSAASSACSIVERNAKELEGRQIKVDCESVMNAYIETIKQQGIAAGYDGVGRKDENSFEQYEPIYSQFYVTNTLANYYGGIGNIRNVNINWGHWLSAGFSDWIRTGLPTRNLSHGGFDEPETTWAIIDDSPRGSYCSSGRSRAIGFSNMLQQEKQ